MISLRWEFLYLEKRVPLTISRGTITHNNVWWLRLEGHEAEGWGEVVDFAFNEIRQLKEEIEAGLARAKELLREFHPLERVSIERRLRAEKIPSAVIAGIDQALWDWLGQSTKVPVTRLWGLDPTAIPTTSVTIGIAPPAAAQERVRQWLALGEVRAFKLKLGSPQGIETDRAMFSAVQEVLPKGVRVSVDANGGWTVAQAIAMSPWLHERGVDHLEQPLQRGEEWGLPEIRRSSPLPVFVDESMFTSADIPPLVAKGAIDGINIKLMKCGGPSEALRMIHTARAHGLRILLGCYGQTALGNTVGAALGPLVDMLDLDSHLNLKDDPFIGAHFVGGRLQLPVGPGFGVSHATEELAADTSPP